MSGSHPRSDFHPAVAGSVRPAAAEAAQPHKGRGTRWLVAHRFQADQRAPEDDGWGSVDQAATAEPMAVGTQVFDERVKSILSRQRFTRHRL